MKLLSVGKFLALLAAVFVVFFWGYNVGKNSEEFKNAKIRIEQLNQIIDNLNKQKESDSISLARLRVSESKSNDELNRMREQLREIDRKAKTDSDRKHIRCLRLATEAKELLDRAERAIEFCAENHK